MTPEAQRIAIAEACGWVPDKANVGPNHKKVAGWWHNAKFNVESQLPDYLNDLNACREAILTLSQEDQAVFWNKLNGVVSRTTPEVKMTFGFHLVNATAAQRCEAFLRTMGKWVES